MTETLYKFYWDCGRSGDLEGVFISTPEEVKNAIGKHVYFGEVLGKHSDIAGTLKEKDITFITDDPNVIAVVIGHDLCSGYNPMLYLPEDEE